MRAETGQHALAQRQIGRAFAVEERQEGQAVGTRRGRRDTRIAVTRAEAEHLRDLFGHHGAVHRADQRQPAATGRTERRPRAAGIDDRPVGVGEQRAGRAEAHRQPAFGDAAGADGRHHVVATAGGDARAGGESELARDRRRHRHQRIGLDQRRQAVGEIARGVGGLEHGPGPGTRPHVQPAGAGGIAVFAPAFTGQHEIQVVVRQQDGRELRVDLGPMLARPRQFGGRVAGEDGIAGGLDAARCAAHRVHDLAAFDAGAGVAPQLGRAQYLARRIDRHEAMLLAGDAQRLDASADAGIDRMEAGAHRSDPRGRLLLAAAVLTADQIQRRTGIGDHPARIGVVDHQLDALGARIESGDDGHGITARPEKLALTFTGTKKRTRIGTAGDMGAVGGNRRWLAL